MLYLFLLYACATIAALELSRWAMGLPFVYELGHLLEKVENPCSNGRNCTASPDLRSEISFSYICNIPNLK